MKADKFFEIIGNIDDEKIEEAENFKRKPNGKAFIKWGALAACIAVAMALSLQIQENHNTTINGDIIIDNPVKEKIKKDTAEKQAKTEEFQKENHLNDSATNDYADNVRIESGDVSQAEIHDESIDNIFDEKKFEEDTYNSFQEESITENTDSAEEYPAPESGGGGGAASGGGSSSGLYKKAIETDSLTSDVSEIFGGAYFDENGNYAVVIIDDTPENRKLIANTLGIDVNIVVFKKGEYTLAYLTTLQEKISNAMVNGEIPFVITSAVMETTNKVEVRVNTNDESELDKVRQLDTMGGAIIFLKM